LRSLSGIDSIDPPVPSRVYQVSTWQLAQVTYTEPINKHAKKIIFKMMNEASRGAREVIADMVDMLIYICFVA